jgi:spermidine synthase
MNDRKHHLWIASGLFVMSGITALVYETVWFKRLGHAWGSSTLAMASVVASFLCGLGLGAWLFGRVADRARRPLAIYGWCELAIGALALAIPFEIAWLLESASGLAFTWADSPLLLALMRFALTFLIIGPPCILMGATLPLLTRQFASHGVSVGASAAWLYAFNTLGAALGAWLAGFFLLERFGLLWTNGFAAALNIAVGLGALSVASRVEAPSERVNEPPLEFDGPAIPLRWLNAAAVACGLGSITLQMLWARELALLVGATTYAFSATITVFILGLGLGSLWFRVRFADRARLDHVVSLAALLVVAPALVGLALEGQFAIWIGHLRQARSSGTFNAALCVTTAAALQFVPAIGMGLIFPALVQLSRSSAARAGHAIARVYGWNTIGSIAGASLAGLWLVPTVGSFWSFRLALALFAIVPCLLFRRASIPVGASIVAFALVFSSWRKPDPLATNLGAFLYGPHVKTETERSMRPAFFREGASCNVLVLESLPDPAQPSLKDVINLRVNGKIDASNGQDMPMQLGIAYVPRFLRPRAKQIAVIGMGSGVTAGASALFPRSQVTVCEIEPQILAASRAFDAVNHRPLDRPNVQVVVDDGRSYLQGHPGGWDLILSEPSNPWIAGVANLFTEEFYRTAQAKLAPGGLLAQWVQTYSFTAEEYALIVRTVQRVFPHCVFLRVHQYDTLLIAGSSEILPTAAVIDEAQELVATTPDVGLDLERWYETRDVRSILLSRMWLDEAGLRRFVAAVGGDALNTDLNLRLEFAAPRRLFHDLGEPGVRTLGLLAGAVDAGFQQAVCSRWNCGPAQLGALKDLKTLLFQNDAVAHASAIVELGLAYEPDDDELSVDRLLFDGRLPREEFEALSTRVIERAPLEGLRLGRQLAQLGQHNAARVVFEQLSTRHPNSATAWVCLAEELRALRRDEDAQKALERARELDPIDEGVHALSSIR